MKITILALLLAFAPIAPITVSHALTAHIQLTPDNVGEDGFKMKSLGENRTRFTIRWNKNDDKQTNAAGFPFVRRGTLELYGDDGLIMRSSVEHSEGKDGYLVYSFELQDDYAKGAVFTVTEFFDDKQVGGGSISSFHFLDFIDPQHRFKDLIDRIK